MAKVKLKMKRVYKSSLIIIGLLIFFVISLETYYYSFYKKDELVADVYVDEYFSINYLNGKQFNFDKKGTIDFSITNNKDVPLNFVINIKNIEGLGKYILYYNDEKVFEGSINKSSVKTDYLSINVNESKTYKLEIIPDSNIKGTLNITGVYENNKTFKDIILENNKYTTDTLTKVAIEPALENEGLIKTTDDLGTSYYFRGNIQNNYVDFAGYTWRIVRINGDDTVRLVLDGEMDTISNYYGSDMKVDFLNSNIYLSMGTWYNEVLANYDEYVANAKYCNDLEYDESNTFSAKIRIMTNNIPSLNCLGTGVKAKIGLLSIDEVILAGASIKKDNKSYYLYNSNISNVWYTMTGYSKTDSSMNLFMVDKNGNIKTNITGDLNRGVRPVINLIKDIKMTGTGSINNPYELYE